LAERPDLRAKLKGSVRVATQHPTMPAELEHATSMAEEAEQRYL
jgi:hypothetical protein